jgi:hypothetical protein
MTIKLIKDEQIPKEKLWKFSGAYSVICLIVLIMAGAHIRSLYPMFIHSYLLIVALAVALTSIIAATLINKRVLAASLLLAFSLLSSFQIIPLYRGLGELIHSKVVTAMQNVSSRHDTWVVVGDDAYNYNESGVLAARPTLSGIQTYPALSFWKQTGDADYNYVTNRESHVVFTDNPNLKTPLTLVHNNSFNVKFECSRFIEDHVQYALSVHPLTEPCVKQIGPTINYPKVTFYIYQVN